MPPIAVWPNGLALRDDDPARFARLVRELRDRYGEPLVVSLGDISDRAEEPGARREEG